MNKKILLTLAAAAMLGLAACGGNQPASSSSSAPASSSSESSAIDTRFDGGIVDLEVGVPADVDGVVAQILSKGITLADGKGAVYVYGEDIAKGVKVGDYIHVEGEVQNYYGVYEIAKPTFTKKEGGQRGLADIVTEAVEMTEAKVQEIFDAIKACAGEGKTPYSVENQIPYKMTGVTAVANDKGPAFKLGNSKLLCPHYYLPANNRTEANRKNEIFEGVEYDVYFYVGGTNSTNNLDIHIYDAVAKFAAPESVSAVDVVELDRGEIISLTASVLPANANQGLVWSVVSGGDYIQLKQNRVKGIAAGEAVVRAAAAADETKYADIAITVSDPEVAYSTSLLTIDDFNTEGEYTGDEFVLSEIDGKSSASYGEFDFPKDKEASVSTVEAIDGIFEVTIDVYGKYNNLKVYSGDEEVSGVKGDTWYGQVGSSFSYTYKLDYAAGIRIYNPGEYKVSVFSIEVRFIKGHEPEGGAYKVTSAGLGLTNSYKDGTATIRGVDWAIKHTADYGDGIQMRCKDNKADQTSAFYNTSSFEKEISKITVTFNGAKHTTKDLKNNIFAAFGAASQAEATEGTLVEYDKETKETVIEIDVPAETHAKYVKIGHLQLASNSFTAYITEVQIDFYD